ncbi:kinase-like domain-containing protein [Apiosordaria backusii]|uniref:Kinase-like domain-containing protein n=1 Tax=Apiosordaria backusii TaxID=314023 RepID=A0AA40EC50_9PEZI|nr:kinase-like domain-containing protein [Apiosordaria backusii]
MDHDQLEGARSPVTSTQPFDDDDESYKTRLAAALGHHDKSTQVFDSQDPAYKAHLQAALGQQEPQPVGTFLDAVDEGTRLLFLPSDPESFELKHADVEGYQSPAGEWMDLRWEVDEDESVETLRVLAVAQSVYNVACDATVRGASATAVLTFRVYFDPSSDDVSLRNTTHNSTILVIRDGQPHDSRPQVTRVYYSSAAQLGPGQWEISLPSHGCTTKLLVLHRRFLPPLAYAGPSEQSGKKRGTLPTARDPGAKRVRGAGPPVNIRTLSAVRNQGVNAATSHPLIDLQTGRTIELIGSRRGEKYSVTRIENLSDSRSSSVWRAIISILTPDHPSVVTKVLKPIGNARSTATMWLRETSIHSKLSAGGLPTIVQLLGLDARVHSLYLEDIAAPSLAHRAWRGPDDYFSGTPADARRVLDDMASALAFVHENGVAHNDIKPGNILFSPARGAVLIDFGLSSDGTRGSVAETQTAGTPWYVPPEFLRHSITGRGPPGDVWALGVVMLYLRHRLPMPDKSTDWHIWAVAFQRGPDAAAAIGRMATWLKKVEAERTQLGSSQMDEVIRQMTAPERPERVTIHAVVGPRAWAGLGT